MAKGEVDMEEVLGESEKLEIRERKELVICKTNKKFFKIN